MNIGQGATDLLNKKFNCAQSVFAALATEVGIDKETALKTAACFGGGMKCGEVCGAVTGALMAIGIKFGSCTEDDLIGKQEAYRYSLSFIKKFKAKYGTLLCKELLGYDTSDPEEMKKAMTKGLHVTVCAKAVSDAAEIAYDTINCR